MLRRFGHEFVLSPRRHPVRRPRAGPRVASGLASGIVLVFLHGSALSATADRSIPTPTSLTRMSAVQGIDQAEERRLVGMVGQNAEDQTAGLTHQLARDGDQGIDEGLEFQSQ
jgi:hypothetical protein